MNINFRNYDSQPFFTNDYCKIRNFLIRINAENLYTPRFLWGAWEWAVTHGGRDQNHLDRIGLWEDDGKLVAIATYECPLGEGFLIVDEAYSHLKPDMITYAKESLHNHGKLSLLLPDNDYEFQRTAAEQGFRATQQHDLIAVLDIDMLQTYRLPDGFSFVSLADGWNWQQYNCVMWRGFDHEGIPPNNREDILERQQMLSSPMINPDLVIAVTAPDGSFVSHCGMWYQPNDFYCLVEPVVTDPEYRKMGLGKAVVLEAIRRCGTLGAKQAVVGSGQQFYYNMGFYPIQSLTYWEMINK